MLTNNIPQIGGYRSHTKPLEGSLSGGIEVNDDQVVEEIDIGDTLTQLIYRKSKP